MTEPLDLEAIEKRARDAWPAACGTPAIVCRYDIPAMITEIRERRKDKERIDWLCGVGMTTIDIGSCETCGGICFGVDTTDGDRSYHKPSLREAIDAAMERGGQP